MNIISINPTHLSDTITAPPSKSFSHRAIICAALSGGKSNVSSIMFSKDILATINGIKKIGSDISIYENSLTINSFKPSADNIIIDCYDSGSTLRFLIPGNISSQYISGMLMALPQLNSDSEIKLTSNLESSKYEDITIDVMKKFDVHIEKTTDDFFIKGNQKYKPVNYVVEGDWSQAAFFMAAGAIGGNITFKNLSRNSSQGDKQIFELLLKFGADVYWNSSDIVVNQSKLKGINIDASEIPDLVPILAVVAANANGVTNITNAERLKFKECDRLEATYKELKYLNVDIKKLNDGLIIKGKRIYNGGMVWSHNDHRMVMALSIMAISISENLAISDFDSVKKSYPHFFKDYNSIGGKTYVINVGK